MTEAQISTSVALKEEELEERTWNRCEVSCVVEARWGGRSPS